MPHREPAPSRVYFDHHLDSSRWNSVPLRSDDIILATSPKSGTTWARRILSVLILGDLSFSKLGQTSLWVDQRHPENLRQMAEQLAAQTHRRFHMSHLPFEALPYDPSVRYIAVGRDGRDVALSLYNHYASYTDFMIQALSGPPGTFPDAYPPAPSDFHAFLRTWLTQGNLRFGWESDGRPFWSHFAQVQSFWNCRDLPNVLLTHYQDLKTDLGGEAARIARFIGIEPSPDLIAKVQDTCTFEAMKTEALETVHQQQSMVFNGGSNTFFNKGISGRWKDVFTSEELALYEAAVKRNLSGDCARWLEQGRLASGIDPSRS
jgi:aryl sulfotransferase